VDAPAQRRFGRGRPIVVIEVGAWAVAPSNMEVVVSDKPVTIAVGTYADRDGAEQDFDAIWGIKHEGQLDHLAIAIVTKDDDGKLKVDRHNTSAKHLAWSRRRSGPASAGWSVTSGTTSRRMS
jgi:hypothetical protein